MCMLQHAYSIHAARKYVYIQSVCHVFLEQHETTVTRQRINSWGKVEGRGPGRNGRYALEREERRAVGEENRR